jgi:hypothetical protein
LKLGLYLLVLCDVERHADATLDGAASAAKGFEIDLVPTRSDVVSERLRAA